MLVYYYQPDDLNNLELVIDNNYEMSSSMDRAALIKWRDCYGQVESIT